MPDCEEKWNPPVDSPSVDGQVPYTTRAPRRQAHRISEDKQLWIWSKGSSCKLSFHISLNNNLFSHFPGCVVHDSFLAHPLILSPIFISVPQTLFVIYPKPLLCLSLDNRILYFFFFFCFFFLGSEVN